MKIDNDKTQNFKMAPKDMPNRVSTKKGKKKLTTPAKIIIAITVVLLVLVIIMGALVLRKYSRIQNAQENANKLYTPSSEEDAEILEEESVVVDPATGVVSDFNDLYSKNKDTIGHISIPNTKLSTPIVRANDNSYYLNHNFFKENVLGIPFADYRSTISQDYMSNNITMYGHAAKDGSYFALLKKYRTVDFYKQHPLIDFDTIYGKGKYKIFGAFIAKVKNTVNNEDSEQFNYQDYIDMTEEEFNTYIAEISKRSYFTTGVDVSYGDQLITLSTCDDEIEKSLTTPYRMVVVARKVRDGENIEAETSVAAPNKSMVMPKAWTEKFNKANPYK